MAFEKLAVSVYWDSFSVSRNTKRTQRTRMYLRAKVSELVPVLTHTPTCATRKGSAPPNFSPPGQPSRGNAMTDTTTNRKERSMTPARISLRERL